MASKKFKSASPNSAKRPNAKPRSSSVASKTDWARIKTMKDAEIRLTPEHPEADLKHIVRGIVRRGLKPVPPKASISLRVDKDVLAWFKRQGKGYQTRINMILRTYMEAKARE